jgi:hypothetical protein
MRLLPRTITRRALLAGAAAVALSETILERSARAFQSPAVVGFGGGIGEAALLSTRNCARDGFFRNPWLPRLFEADLLLDDPALIREMALRAADLVARGRFDSRNFSKLELMTAPKRKHGALRIYAVMEPLDAVAYLTLAVLAADAIESNRVGAGKNVVHSFRFSPSRDGLFDERFNFASFLAAALDHSMTDGYVVNCDLANCYGSLTHERIAAGLERCGVPDWQVGYVSDLLSFWRHADNPGLPVGSSGSSIFSEAVLSQIDRRLADAGIEFVRYVDDFRLFAADEAEARLALEAVGAAAACHGLSINTDKTRIVQFVSKVEDEAVSSTNPQPSWIAVSRNTRSGKGTSAKQYTDVLPLNFRRASVKEIQFLRRIKRAPEAAAFLQGEFAAPEKLRRAIRRAIYAGHDKFVRAIPPLLDRYPEFAAYVASALTRTTDFVHAEIRHHLRRRFAARLANPATPDFVAMKLLDVLSHPGYRDRRALERFAQARAATPRGLCFRLSLDALRNTGGLAPELYGHFDRMDGWGRRGVLADPGSRAVIKLAFVQPDPLTAKIAR